MASGQDIPEYRKLPKKEQDLFRSIVRFYETKQYKKVGPAVENGEWQASSRGGRSFGVCFASSRPVPMGGVCLTGTQGRGCCAQKVSQSWRNTGDERADA
jgi:hypothetical protein